MTTDYGYTDAPPLGDEDFPLRTAGVPSPDATAICIALNRVAAALERLSVSPGGAPLSAPPLTSGSPSGAAPPPPGGVSNDSQIKRGKKIYAICRQNEWDIADIGQRVVGHAVNPNSQKWAEADQIAVLDAFKEWGVG